MRVFQLPVSTAAVTTTTTATTSFEVSSAVEGIVYLAVTAVSGTTPSLTAVYQTSPDDGVTWFDNASSTAITAASNVMIKLSGTVGERARLNYTVSGTTPSFTITSWFEGKRWSD